MSRMGWERVEDVEELEKEDFGLRGRLFFFRIAVVAILGLLLYRVYWIQQNSGEELGALAQENQFAILRNDAPRGVIFDRDGDPLAINIPSFNVTITPTFLPDDPNELQAIYERLSLLTGVPVTNTVAQQTLVEAANPELIETYTRLAQIYGVSGQETLAQAGVVPQLPDSIAEIVRINSPLQFIPAVITSGIPITQAYNIEQESIFLPGVRVLPEPLRYYPTAEYTSPIIGFMGPLPNENWLNLGLGYQRDDRVGWAGLESSMEIEMAGTKGERQIEVDWTGRELRQIGTAVDPVPGLNLHLTLDIDLQIIATEILRQAMATREETPSRDPITGQEEDVEVQQGAVVVMNPQTGEILAMVSLPSFDNNRFQTEVPVDYYLGQSRNEYQPFVNHAVSSIYPPGSTFKIVPGSAALQEGIVSATRLLNAPGEITIPNRFAPNDPGRAQTFFCWLRTGHGAVNAITGMANSCDIYFYKISGGFDQDGEFVEGLGIDRLSRYASQFGFGRVQGIELPLEAAGDLPPDRGWKARVYGEPWSTGDDYNTGIGQGFLTASPLQVAQMAAVIANGGFLYRPTIIHHMTDSEGNIVFVNDDSQIVARASLGGDGRTILTDGDGNPLDDPSLNVRFDANGEYIYQPEVLNAVDVDRENIETVAEGLRLVNTRIDEERFYTGATYVEWLEPFGIVTAGKTGTAEFCDNIAIEKGWCSFDDIEQRRILPTHSWYVGYAPFDNPEIVVAAFLYHGGEGSQWAAPVACNVMAAYFGLAQYAQFSDNPDVEFNDGDTRACNTAYFNPVLPPDLLDQVQRN
ncbi:MAG: penicillin-binding protein 2 [Ardenticatenaceae bacterium]|nr:penicillin-binding protein 2 [Ardenticatenaceae bacterium]MCB8975246.1 penicillin-binding protein 2 [Ardenticatenaceae bacterium]